MNEEDFKRILKEAVDSLKEQITEVAKRLDDPETGLQSLNFKVGDITAELSEVHKLAGGTFDLVKLESQKWKHNMSEIREHVGLPPITPSEP